MWRQLGILESNVANSFEKRTLILKIIAFEILQKVHLKNEVSLQKLLDTTRGRKATEYLKRFSM